jgi:hypothetical protein
MISTKFSSDPVEIGIAKKHKRTKRHAIKLKIIRDAGMEMSFKR